jgi:hypothetical protein
MVQGYTLVATGRVGIHPIGVGDFSHLLRNANDTAVRSEETRARRAKALVPAWVWRPADIGKGKGCCQRPEVLFNVLVWREQQLVGGAEPVLGRCADRVDCLRC